VMKASTAASRPIAALCVLLLLTDMLSARGAG
jgi:hypothetical protein